MTDEKTLQEDFYNKLREIDGTIAQIDNWTDGVIRGTIIENKIKIDNPNEPLIQAITYLSRFRNMAYNIPGHIMTIDFTKKYIRLYDSNDFLEIIEQPHFTSPSKSNKTFITDIKPLKQYSYINNLKEVIEDLQYNEFIKVHIDFYNIVANSQRFYKDTPLAQTKKLAFRKELLNPKILNIYPISENELKLKEQTEFAGVIDCLNDKLLQKELGAFYTPDPYVKLSTRMVRDAIKRIKKVNPNNDYIILDRCAGTGNLEKFFTDKNISDLTLNELQNYIPDTLYNEYIKDKKIAFKILDKNINDITVGELENFKTHITMYDYIFDNELSHCVLSTYETWEWTILNANYSNKVRLIIPPEGTINKKHSLVIGADALSEVFITGNESTNLFGNSEINKTYLMAIKQLKNYITNKNCNIILYENPPYRNSSLSHENSNKNFNKSNYIYEQIKDSDLANQFIWSGYEYYLKKDNDYFVLYSPIRYWKVANLSNKKYINGYIFNRNFFGEAGASAISCIEWKNEDKDDKEIKMHICDICDEYGNYPEKIGKLYNISSKYDIKPLQDITVKKVFHDISEYYGKDTVNKSIVLGYNGYEDNRNKNKNKNYTECIGYLISRYFSYELPRQNCCLIRTTHYRGGGFALTKENFIKKLPLFVLGRNDKIEQTWYLNGIIYKSADKGNDYESDLNFLKKCMIYTCLTNRNHCISFIGSDKHFYRNELCLLQNTIADTKLKKFDLDDRDKSVIKEWKDVLQVTEMTDEYKKLKKEIPNITLGLYQIEQAIDVYEYKGITYTKLEKSNLIKTLSKKEKNQISHKYPDLVKEITELKQVLKEYYKTEIEEKLYTYELLK